MKENITKDDVIEFLEQQESNLEMYKRHNQTASLYNLMRCILRCGFDCRIAVDYIRVKYYTLTYYEIEEHNMSITYEDNGRCTDYHEKAKILSANNVFATKEDATKTLDASLDRLKKTVGQIESRLNETDKEN